jgi:hemerythrin-like domain-containing protein
MNPTHARLDQDHRDIETLLDGLAHQAATSSPALRATFNQLEQRLMTHMELEEQYLLPLVEASHHAEAERTRLEHDRIRQLISELGLAMELRTAREHQVRDLIQVLREHADREDFTIYRLAGDLASTAVEHRLATLLRGASRSALAAAKRAVDGAPIEDRRAS